MVDILIRLLPVALGFAAGFVLRRLQVAEQRDGDFLFKLIIYICLPALIFGSLSAVDLSAALAVFPLAALAAMSAGFAVSRLVASRVNWPPTQTAVLIVASMIVNSGFELPFVQAIYGADGIARIAAFEAVNMTLTFTWAYYMAAKGNPQYAGGSFPLQLLVRSPALWAIAAGIIVNLTGAEVPEAISGALSVFGAATGMLISLGVGILFQPPGRGVAKALLIVGIRLVTGLTVAIVFVTAFGLSGIDRTVILLMGVAPVGFGAVPFASLENLDTKLAVDALSLSLLVSLVLSLGVTITLA